MDYRTDRNTEIICEFKRLNIPESKIIRFSAIKDNIHGSIGCTKSHIEVIKMAQLNEWNSILILEDDFNFIDKIEKINDAFNIFFNNFKQDWDAIHLARGYTHKMIDLENFSKEFPIKKIKYAAAPSGYIVNKNFYEILLNNLTSGLELLINTKQYKIYTLDVYWSSLQPLSKWYTFHPSLGYQRTSYSDIDKRINANSQYDKSLIGNKNTLKYISSNIKEGLSNQLFQIAAAYCLGWEFGLTPLFEKIEMSPSVFGTRPTYWNSMLSKIPVLPKNRYEKIQFQTISEKSLAFQEIVLNNNNNYKLDGYFQSPKYLNKYKQKIIELFINEQYMNTACNIYNDILSKYNNFTNVTSLHIRRTDYLSLSHIHFNLNMNYYKLAMENLPEDTLYLIFSDDINWCKDNLNFIQNKHFVENLNDINELYLMSKCDNHIIANSTFSWWGTCLNNKENKKVIAPVNWFVCEKMNNDIKDIYEDGWIIIDQNQNL